MSKLKLAWKDMNDEERAIFGPRWKAPVLVVAACLLTLATSFGMFLIMGAL